MNKLELEEMNLKVEAMIEKWKSNPIDLLEQE
jgi:hypothetical protein